MLILLGEMWCEGSFLYFLSLAALFLGLFICAAFLLFFFFSLLVTLMWILAYNKKLTWVIKPRLATPRNVTLLNLLLFVRIFLTRRLFSGIPRKLRWNPLSCCSFCLLLNYVFFCGKVLVPRCTDFSVCFISSFCPTVDGKAYICGKSPLLLFCNLLIGVLFLCLFLSFFSCIFWFCCFFVLFGSFLGCAEVPEAPREVQDGSSCWSLSSVPFCCCCCCAFTLGSLLPFWVLLPLFPFLFFVLISV